MNLTLVQIEESIEYYGKYMLVRSMAYVQWAGIVCTLEIVVITEAGKSAVRLNTRSANEVIFIRSLV